MVRHQKSAGFECATADEDEVFNHDDVRAIFSFTRHDQHFRHVMKAIQSQKHIFVEKPLCLTLDELQQIEDALREKPSNSTIMVGFNRRFAKSTKQIKEFFQDVASPLTVSFRFNAGDIPADHWTQDDVEGGGRIIGEACHAIDLATYLTGSIPIRVFAESVVGDSGTISDDQCFITIRHANGSISNIGYVSSGDKAFPKERIEVIGGGRVGVIDDFKTVTTCRGGKQSSVKDKMDKGHASEIKSWANAIKNNNWLIPFEEIRAVTAASILAVRSLREGLPIEL